MRLDFDWKEGLSMSTRPSVTEPPLARILRAGQVLQQYYLPAGRRHGLTLSEYFSHRS